jgi:hypothetical protein
MRFDGPQGAVRLHASRRRLRRRMITAPVLHTHVLIVLVGHILGDRRSQQEELPALQMRLECSNLEDQVQQHAEGQDVESQQRGSRCRREHAAGHRAVCGKAERGDVDWTVTASVDCGSGRPANGTPAEPCRNAWQPFH